MPGFEAPVRQALTAPILLAGAPRAYVILNWTLAATIAFAFTGVWYVGLVVGVLGQIAGTFLARRDADIMDVLKRAMKIRGWLEC